MKIGRFAATAAALAIAATVTSFDNGFVVRADESVDLDTGAGETEGDESPAAEAYQPPENAESFTFEAEVSRMLDIVVNSLYQNKDVFLRELISNASDALDKIRFMGLTDTDLMKDKEELEIRIQYDEEGKTLTIVDSGIGMTKEDLVKNLGTVARSGTTKFLEAIEAAKKTQVGNLIGQFGVGFYSTFLVADRVTVASKSPGDPVQHIWESTNGADEFYVAEDPRGNTLGRGTEITLHLKEDAEHYAEGDKLRELVQHYSEFITHPIHLRLTTSEWVEVDEEESETDLDEEKDDEEKDEDDLEVGDDEDEDDDEDTAEKTPKKEKVTTHSWEEINNSPAIWTREKEEITDDEYQSFFKVVSKESYQNASTWIHFNAEGNINFKSLLYLPQEIPSHLKGGHIGDNPTGGLKLYVRKVLISDEFELLPRYLSFVKGVVDSDDLPLNVNRETLQESNIIKVIQKKLVRKVLEMMKKLADSEKPKKDDDDDEEKDKVAEAEVDADGNVKEPEEKDEDEDEEDEEDGEKKPYLTWYKDFSNSIKLGIMEDSANKDKLAKLLRYQSSKSDGEFISLQDYVDNMHEWQEDIYFYGGTSVQEMENSAFMDKFYEKDVEVIYMIEPVDEYMVQSLPKFGDKKFMGVTREGIKFKDEDEDLLKRRDKAYREMYKPLIRFLKELFGQNISRVAISKRLGKAPAIVSSAEWGHNANMDRIMRAQAYQHGQDVNSGRAMKILEINPRHPFVKKLLDNVPEEPEKKRKDEDDDEEEEEEEEEEVKEMDPILQDAAWMMLDMALLNGGFPIEDTAGYTDRMIRVLQNKMDISSLSLEEEINPPVEEEEAPEIDEDDAGEGMNLDDFDFEEFDMDATAAGEEP